MPEAPIVAPPIGLSGPNQQIDNSVTAHVPKPLLKTVAPVEPAVVAAPPKHRAVSKIVEKHEKARVARAAVAATAPEPVVVAAASPNPVAPAPAGAHRDAWTPNTPTKR